MSGSKTEMEPLHTDYPAKGKVNLAYSAKPSKRSFVSNFIRVLGSYISLMCTVYPTPCAILMFALIGLALFGLGEAIFNPRIKYGYIAHDHSNLKSIFDFQVANIDHWCLRGDSKSCRCEDPLQPISRAEHNSWKVAFKTNRKIVQALEADPSSDIDIAFVGESVVEEMDGRWMGIERGGNLATLKKIFDDRFNKKKGADLSAVALGIAGDTAPNVLFRLMHGEMSQKLHPKIYWLSLGMNDLSRMQCSEEVVVLGILRVVEEIIKNTNSFVVINSVFPMSAMRGSAYPMLTDKDEAFRTQGIRGQRGRYNPQLAAPRAQVPRTPGAGDNRRLQRVSARAPTDDELKAQAEKEEEARVEEWKRRHHERVQAFRDRYKNQGQLTERHRIRKHSNIRKLPLWTSVQAVNEQLAKYARNNVGRITFFDATTLFTERQDSKHYELRLDRITPRGHPTQVGYTVWEDAIADFAKILVKKWKAQNPENVYVPSSDDEDADPFDVDAMMDHIQNMPDDFLGDDVYQNQDDAWLDRLGEEDEFDDDDSIGDDNVNDDGQDDDTPEVADEQGDDDDDNQDDDGGADDDNA